MWESDLVGEFTICDLAHVENGGMQLVSLVGANRLSLSPRP
jgi:hypothetical protein